MGPRGGRPDLAEAVWTSGQEVIKKLAYPRDGESDQDAEDLEVFDGQDVGGGVGSGIVLEGGVGLTEVLELVKDGA